jgi:hypothetical protein
MSRPPGDSAVDRHASPAPRRCQVQPAVGERAVQCGATVGMNLRQPGDRRFFTRPVVTLMLIGGIWSALVNFGLFAWALRSGRGLAEAMTMTFVLLVLIQFYKAYLYEGSARRKAAAAGRRAKRPPSDR